MAKKDVEIVGEYKIKESNLKSLKRISEVLCTNINILAGKASLGHLFKIEREAEENSNVLSSTILTEEELAELKSHVKTLLRFPKNYKDQDALVDKVTDLILQTAEVVLLLKVK